MCYEWGDAGAYHALKKPAELAIEVALQCVAECAPAKPKYEFFGGEPLLYRNLYPLIAAILAGGSTLSFSTNGTLLARHAERLIATPPTRIWVSLDGPMLVNDRQRGRGVFKRAAEGIAKLAQLRADAATPEIGVACVITPENWQDIDVEFIESLELSAISAISLELVCYATAEQLLAHRQLMQRVFGVHRTPCADAYQRSVDDFTGIDTGKLSEQIARIRALCNARGIELNTQPSNTTAENLAHYFAGRFNEMQDRRSRCAVPWVSAEITARGDVGTCHSFYDLSLGNVYQQSLIDIWQGKAASQFRGVIRDQLLPICTACCRYYGGAGAK
jgi:radical SAM protein with 4Fe4S-binding SPASM domain